MPQEFCDHLGVYSHNWNRAEAAYRALGKATERLLDEGATDDCLDLMEVALKDWQFEVKQLRERFATLVRRGAITLPAGDGDEAPSPDDGASCTACGFVVPRLVWSDWAGSDNGRPTFRGNVLHQGEGVPVAQSD
jgi:hypothetical protein